MKLSVITLDLCATDISRILDCRHRTALDMAVPRRALKQPATGLHQILEALRGFL